MAIISVIPGPIHMKQKHKVQCLIFFLMNYSFFISFVILFSHKDAQKWRQNTKTGTWLRFVDPKSSRFNIWRLLLWNFHKTASLPLSYSDTWPPNETMTLCNLFLHSNTYNDLQYLFPHVYVSDNQQKLQIVVT